MTTVKILKCPACGNYALSETCACGGKRLPPKPAKYSPDDKYAAYRRKYKEGLRDERVVERTSSNEDNGRA